jgi:hypothetical protein
VGCGNVLSDDVYRAKLTKTFHDLKRFAATLTGVAHVDLQETPDFVKLSALPLAAGACPVEMMLRADQLYDIAIGTEFYEDCPIDDLGLFELLLAAVVRGDVVQRHTVSVATETHHAIETIVHMVGRAAWRRGHVLGVCPPTGDVIARDRRFLPYLR